MSSFTIPNIIVFNIIGELLDNEHLPFKYKLSLGLINSVVFKWVSERIVFSERCLSEPSGQDHLENKYCLFKKVRNMVFNKDSKYLDINQSVRDSIVDLEIHYTDQFNCQTKESAMVTVKNYPKLQSLYIRFIKPVIQEQDIQMINEFPLVKELFIHTLQTADHAQLLLKVLDRVKPTIQSLTIGTFVEAIMNNYPLKLPDEIVRFLCTYCPNQLKSLHFTCDNPASIKTILHNQIDSLTAFSQTFYLDPSLDFVEQSTVLKSLYIRDLDHDQFTRLLNICNQKPHLKSLSLNLGAPFPENMEWKIFNNIQRLHLEATLDKLEKFLKSNSNEDSKLTHVSLHPILSNNTHVSLLPSIHQFFDKNRTLLSFECKIKLIGDQSEVTQSHLVSVAISQHPTIKHLFLHLHDLQSEQSDNTKILSKLHHSNTLDYITINANMMRKQPPFPELPFALTLEKRKYFYFIRGGIHYQENTSSTTTTTSQQPSSPPSSKILKIVKSTFFK
ncbi:hypothetical protein DLAC_00876 [Tieghemostelium lacteum]|uniref:Uncharacterized protein n=1 Tax=Tieghemostelium lacteum TaxID=361077 RepID=A0A152A796_TIELA|nr:hypothetical protein DLAC_00876 [Tieghemostelium lacteum]|eukprot:KYR02076.1 hypothetical protein DLAC_00876 [Tieghemostelium lacteum]